MYSFKKKSNPLPSIKAAQSDYREFASPLENSISSTSKTAVVVPCYIRDARSADQLKRLYQTLIGQEVKPDLVIFVDDCSPYPYDESAFGGIVFRKQKKNCGPATARNVGLEYALSQGADIVAFTDSDCILSPGWMSSIKHFFLNNKYANILSGNTLSYGNSWFDKYHELNGTLNGRMFKGKEHLLYGPTANLAITKNVGISIEFDTSFPNAAGEDIDFCLQANRCGFRAFFCEDMKIEHDYGYGRSFIGNLKRFIKQFERYADGEKVLLDKNPSYYMYFENTKEISVVR
ncbi:MAG: glycosyltransferase family 2 protein [Bacteroidales bacterium]|nr:glycosyltransferase family 2 protein [Bacteroidales bacterium]